MLLHAYPAMLLVFSFTLSNWSRVGEPLRASTVEKLTWPQLSQTTRWIPAARTEMVCWCSQSALADLFHLRNMFEASLACGFTDSPTPPGGRTMGPQTYRLAVTKCRCDVAVGRDRY